MSNRIVKIERVSPRKGVIEEPEFTTRGYKLGNPSFGDKKHHAANAIYVRTLDEVGALLEKGYSLWMSAKGKRASLISPGSLRIVRTKDS